MWSGVGKRDISTFYLDIIFYFMHFLSEIVSDQFIRCRLLLILNTEESVSLIIMLTSQYTSKVTVLGRVTSNRSKLVMPLIL